MKNLFALLLAVIMIWSSYSTITAFAKTEVPTEDSTPSEGVLLKQSINEDKGTIRNNSTNANIVISNEEIKAFENNEQLMKIVEKKDKNGKKKHIDGFAGSYIGDDKTLVVQFTKKADEEVVDNCMNSLSSSAEVEFVNITYDELKAQHDKDSDTMARINKAVEDGSATDLEKTVSENLVGIALSQRRNCNIVTLKKVTEETKNNFISCFGDDNVIFEESRLGSIKECKTIVKPGSSFAIYQDGTYYIGRSVGPRMCYDTSAGNTIYGFLTAAHCVDEMGQLVYYKKDGKYIKYGKVSTYKRSEFADAAFIKQTNNTDFSTSRYTKYSNSSGNTSEKYKACQNCAYGIIGHNIVEGGTIYKCGSKTYLTKGKVTNTSFSCTISGRSFKDLVSTTCKCDSGDSGGVVFTIHNSDKNTYDVSGVVTAKTLDGNNHLIFTSIERYDDYMMEKHDCDGFWQY